jgi:hypothetical protein
MDAVTMRSPIRRKFRLPRPRRRLLHMADALADTPSNVSDELYAELRRHFPRNN